MPPAHIFIIRTMALNVMKVNNIFNVSQILSFFTSYLFSMHIISIKLQFDAGVQPLISFTFDAIYSIDIESTLERTVMN